MTSINLLIVLDVSLGLQPADLALIRQFLKDFIAQHKISEDGTNIGLIVFSDQVC